MNLCWVAQKQTHTLATTKWVYKDDGCVVCHGKTWRAKRSELENNKLNAIEIQLYSRHGCVKESTVGVETENLLPSVFQW